MTSPIPDSSDSAAIKAPIITHAFAVDKGRYGDIWKIYIEAEDPEGDMEKIAVVVDQTGYGCYPTDWIVLRPPFRKHLIGYLQWNTFSSKASYLPGWTRITTKVSILDKAGNESNQVIFPFTFESGAKTQPYEFSSSNAPGLVKVDTEQRFSPRPKGWGLTSSKHQFGSLLPSPFDKGNMPRLGHITIDLYYEGR